MVLSRAIANNIYTICGTPSLERRYPASRNGGFTAQEYSFKEWYDQLGGEASPLADAIIDRIVHDSYQINITSIDAEHDLSMREVYGLDKTLRE